MVDSLVTSLINNGLISTIIYHVALKIQVIYFIHGN